MNAARKSDVPDILPNLFENDEPPAQVRPKRTTQRGASRPANDDIEREEDAAGDLFDAPDSFADGPIKPEPEALELRGRPIPVKRLSPRAIILITSVALAALGGLFIAALRPPKIKTAEQPAELYESNHKPKPAELEELPKTYDAKTYEDWLEQIRQGKTPGSAPDIPQLGPPLPGDIGHAYAIQSGLAPASGMAAAQTNSPYASSAQTSALQQQHAEKLRQLEQARGSGLFFTGKSGGAGTSSQAPENTDMMNLLTQLGLAQNHSSLSAASVYTTGGQTAADIENAHSGTSSTASDITSGQYARDAGTLNPHPLTPLASPYTVLAGSLIPAALIGDMNSDLPGIVQAQVTQNVYDSATGKWLLIPQGSKLIGKYDARVLFGQERALLVWMRLILPDGSSMILDQFSGTDARGQAGLSDKVDWHTGKLLKGVILSSLLGVGSELSVGNTNDDSLRALARAIQDSGNSAGQEIIRRNLQVKPTIRIRGGTRLNVLVSSDLILKPWEPQK